MLSGPIPRHVAIIMDGNGRWASERRLPRPFGHRAGMKAVREAVEGAIDAGVEVLTLFAFSEENWNRPALESPHSWISSRNTSRRKSPS